MNTLPTVSKCAVVTIDSMYTLILGKIKKWKCGTANLGFDLGNSIPPLAIQSCSCGENGKVEVFEMCGIPSRAKYFAFEGIPPSTRVSSNLA